MRVPVVLLPGLWMPAVAMAFLAARLSAAGFSPRIFAYRGRDAIEDNVARLARFATSVPGAPAGFVGHSLGGVVILEALLRHPALAAAAAVLVGSPVRGCGAGRRLGRAALGRWMMGNSRAVWEERAPRWTRREPLGVIAGTAPVGLGRVLGPLTGPNDGVVCVSETMVDGMKEQALVAHGHSALIFSPRVARLVERFLREGRFS